MLPAALALWACSQGPISSPGTSPGAPMRSAPASAPAWCARAPSSKPARPSAAPACAAPSGPSPCRRRPTAAVQLRPPALLRCPMVPAVDHWVERVVMPAARYHFAPRVVELKVAASYSCRPMNHVDGARLSEHGHANAVDISAFVLADGRVVRSRPAGGAQWPSATSCARCTAAPATSSPRCWAPPTTPTTATTSISTSPATAATARADLQVAHAARRSACARRQSAAHGRVATSATPHPPTLAMPR